MESLPCNKIMKFRPNLMWELRTMYNLDKPGQMDEMIDLLQDWLKKQEHLLKKNYSREYLERAIILHKGSVERAKASMDKICTFRTIMPEFFDKYDVKSDFQQLKGNFCAGILPNLTEDNYRAIVMKFCNNDFSAKFMTDCYKFIVLVCEYIQGNDYSVGVVGIYDLRDIILSKMISTLNLFEITKILTILMKGYMFRLKGTHFITSSKTIEILINILKSILSEKFANRIYVHRDLESLYTHVPKEILPTDLNGNEKSLAALFDGLYDHFGTEENVEFLKEMLTKARVEKSYKQVEEFNDIYNGVQGTFRTLNVD